MNLLEFLLISLLSVISGSFSVVFFLLFICHDVVSVHPLSQLALILVNSYSFFGQFILIFFCEICFLRSVMTRNDIHNINNGSHFLVGIMENV